MDYKEKYEQALEKARELMDKGYDVLMPEIFPELQESEDEKVRQEIRNFIWGYPDKLPERTRWLAWFEKQGEHKPTDKVEPLFHGCEWITNGDYTWKILEVKPLDYILQSQDGNIVDDTISYVDEHFHLWTIQEAKDGDVLINWNNTTFIFRAIEDETVKFHIAYNERLNTIATPLTKLSHQGLAKPEFEFHPASKEQCDTLFAKMKKAGYKWDADKKELKKIEPKKVNADKVIEWLKNTIKERAENYGVYKATRLILPPYNSIEDLINDFKKDFGL